MIAATALACGSDVTAPTRPTPAVDPALAVGRDAYVRACGACHGVDMEGTAVGPSLRSIVYEPAHHPDETFRAAIRDGVAAHHWDFGPMPAIPGIDDDEATAIIAWVRSEQQRLGFLPAGS